jgi:hypothetical protein
MAARSQAALRVEQGGRDPLDFSDIALPEEADPVTLEQVLGEPISLGTLWPGACYLSPKMREIKGLFRGLSDLESRTPESVEEIVALMDDYSALAQRLVRVPVERGAPVPTGTGEEGAYRQPTIDEIQARFDLAELKVALMRMLRKEGFLEENGEGNARGEPTGAPATGA